MALCGRGNGPIPSISLSHMCIKFQNDISIFIQVILCTDRQSTGIQFVFLSWLFNGFRKKLEYVF